MKFHLPKARLSLPYLAMFNRWPLGPALDSAVSNVISAAVVRITDASGNIIQNGVSIPLSNINGSYMSNPIALITGITS